MHGLPAQSGVKVIASLGVEGVRVNVVGDAWVKDELRGVRSGFLRARCLSLLQVVCPGVTRAGDGEGWW